MTIFTITLILEALQLLELRKLQKTNKGSFDELENLSGISFEFELANCYIPFELLMKFMPSGPDGLPKM